ncbi:hypothetical protein AKJ61_02860 [candidate division MSBL1 archaeon SCGC-AAA259B11]|uniref:RDD domain-containing protein n=1 Tax=candidate division MSBL1 archaeon SCGC-AAA259B11 TaxID=1698260 RepID=A0A133U5I4_9EURY|nr:hypothetical protein AKJ61_02860 [candidate division MSBL1 archaeon SCGC-AAA259B11]
MDREKISKEFKSENSNQFTSKGQIFQSFLAPFWKRLVAWLVDQAFLALAIFVLLYLIAGNLENFIDFLSYSPILLVLADVLGNLTYFTILEGSTSQTLGKKLLEVIILDIYIKSNIYHIYIIYI